MTAAAALLALVGAVDDIRTLPAALRLLLQCIAVGGVIAALPKEWQILPVVPWWVERACLFFGGVWLVNLVNFMDGIDWMTVAETVPVTGAIVLLGLSGAIAPLPALVAAALLGAMLGFAPFNKPVARLFLGDVGSLPIGLLLGWLLAATRGQRPSGGGAHPAALLPRRRDHHARRPHRSGRAGLAGASQALLSARDRQRFHRSADRRRVFLVNLALAALALASVVCRRIVLVSVLLLAAAAAIVGWLLDLRARQSLTQVRAHAAWPPKSGTASRKTP